jgi:hypothetical protein
MRQKQSESYLSAAGAMIVVAVMVAGGMTAWVSAVEGRPVQIGPGSPGSGIQPFQNTCPGGSCGGGGGSGGGVWSTQCINYNLYRSTATYVDWYVGGAGVGTITPGVNPGYPATGTNPSNPPPTPYNPTRINAACSSSNTIGLEYSDAFGSGAETIVTGYYGTPGGSCNPGVNFCGSGDAWSLQSDFATSVPFSVPSGDTHLDFGAATYFYLTPGSIQTSGNCNGYPSVSAGGEAVLGYNFAVYDVTSGKFVLTTPQYTEYSTGNLSCALGGPGFSASNPLINTAQNLSDSVSVSPASSYEIEFGVSYNLWSSFSETGTGYPPNGPPETICGIQGVGYVDINDLWSDLT